MPKHLVKTPSSAWNSDRGPYEALASLSLAMFVLAPLLSARILMPAILEISFLIILIAFVLNSRVSIRLFVAPTRSLSVLLHPLGARIQVVVNEITRGNDYIHAFVIRNKRNGTLGIKKVLPG
jgi:hypothetical protein